MNTISSYSIRPRRKICYMSVTQKEIDDYYKGIIPEIIAKYENAFGTYGYPGIFLIKQGDVNLKVIGIEYRPDDDRVEYPKDLEEIDVESTFFRTDVILDDGADLLNDERMSSYLKTTCIESPVYYYHNGLKLGVKVEPEIVQIYVSDIQNKVLISAEHGQTAEFSGEKEDEASYKEKYFHDMITGYYNWNYIAPRIANCNYYGIDDYALVYFDIKDFNAVNVVFGHITANELLIDICNHMQNQDWIYFSARCDNDNFAMMIKDMTKEETERVLRDFFEEISHLKVDENYKVYYRAGVVPMRTTTELGTTVADAGKQAKAYGNTPFSTDVIFFTDAMRGDQEKSIRLRNYLDTAIEKDEFIVYFQPKFDINTEKIKGAEALIRWKYKGKEIINPADFVPIFEAGGLISKIDDIVLRKVCENIKKWEKDGKNLYPVSVNVSRKSVGIPGLVDHLTEIVDSYGIDHALIDFEITETASYDSQKNMIEVITDLRDRGFRISMDDFGTGYSSLSLLPIMPFNTLKIDKSFVDGISESEDSVKNNAVVKQIIALSKELNLTCLAEGAENKEQVDILRKYGCEIIQGFYYSRPLPVDEFEKML